MRTIAGKDRSPWEGKIYFAGRLVKGRMGVVGIRLVEWRERVWGVTDRIFWNSAGGIKF